MKNKKNKKRRKLKLSNNSLNKPKLNKMPKRNKIPGKISKKLKNKIPIVFSPLQIDWEVKSGS